VQHSTYSERLCSIAYKRRVSAFNRRYKRTENNGKKNSVSAPLAAGRPGGTQYCIISHNNNIPNMPSATHVYYIIYILIYYIYIYNIIIVRICVWRSRVKWGGVNRAPRLGIYIYIYNQASNLRNHCW